MTNTPPAPPSETAAPTASVIRLDGPSGSLVMVEENRATPVVQIVIATRTGAALDPRPQDGLANLSAEVARHGAAGRTRQEIDAAIDALGADLDVITDLDSIRLVGHVLENHLDAFLTIVADIILRPDFRPDEVERTRREVMAQIDEMRNDDRTLVGRFFARRLYGRHGYGNAIDGTHASLARLQPETLAQQHRKTFIGKNLIFAATGAVTPTQFADRIQDMFQTLPTGTPSRMTAPRPRAPEGWRMQVVDKPDRKQVQIMFGHLGLPATHPDQLPLALALASFGGPFMNATMMAELRVARGLAYGAYMRNLRQRDVGSVRGWLSTGVDRAVDAIKLALRLYGELMKNGLSEERLDFVKSYLIGSYASQMDSPASRLAAQVTAEVQGLSPDFVDSYPDRLRAVTKEQVASAMTANIHPRDLAITLVASADVLVPLLVQSGIDRHAIDVDGYDSF